MPEDGAAEAAARDAVPLAVDVTFALRSAVASGLSEDGLDALAARLPELVGAARRERASGGLAFLDLADRREDLASIRAWNEGRPSARDLVLVGIGGSALGARVLDALRPTPDAGPRLHVVDTVDPRVAEGLVRDLDPGATILVAVSKSGTTLETAAVLGVLEAWLHDALGAGAPSRVAVVAGEDPNPLRARAAERGYACFPVPRGVAGRYSVLSAVGLLPAVCGGVDVDALLGGASWAAGRALEEDLWRNPAFLLAALGHLAWEAGRRTVVLWTYGERLRPLGPWWVQLVAESLGKQARGPTPLAAVGPADQHSLLQLLLDGPDDKLSLFAHLPGGAQEGPTVPADAEDLGPVGGSRLGAILAAEREATAFAIARAGRPAAAIELEAAGAAGVGAFLATWQAAVAWAARLLGVDAFDQPAVALGKEAARARLRGEPPDLAEALRREEGRPRRRSR